MTKAEIIAVVDESARLVADKKVGVTPIKQSHRDRLEELKRKKARSGSSLSGGESGGYSIAAASRDY